MHLDETLVEGLVKGQMKKDASGAWPTRMSRKELADLFKGRVTVRGRCGPTLLSMSRPDPSLRRPTTLYYPWTAGTRW